MTQDRDNEQGTTREWETGTDAGRAGQDDLTGGGTSGGYGADTGYAGASGAGDHLGGEGGTDLGGDLAGGMSGDVGSEPAYGGQSVQTDQMGGDAWGDRTGDGDLAGDTDLTGDSGLGGGAASDQEDRGQGI